jgi:hypothetical protein
MDCSILFDLASLGLVHSRPQSGGTDMHHTCDELNRGVSKCEEVEPQPGGIQTVFLDALKAG